MTEYEKWCERCAKTDLLYLLDRKNMVSLVKVQDKKSVGNPMGRAPLYAVWNHHKDKMVYIRPGYRAGCDRFFEEVRKNG